MSVVTVEFTLHPEHSRRFIQRVRQQASDSLELEPDCHIFGVCADLDEIPPGFFYMRSMKTAGLSTATWNQTISRLSIQRYRTG